MKRSETRILTTHAGSLPRPTSLLALLNEKESGRLTNGGRFEKSVRSAVDGIAQQQVKLGVDVISDGEMGKHNFLNYFKERLTGFEPVKNPKPWNPWAGSREVRSFPEYYAETMGAPVRRAALVCTGPITYVGHGIVKRDIDNLKAATNKAKASEAFLPAISPANIEDYQKNLYYKSQEEYLFAIADAMHEEYKAIADAGLLVQIDDPRLVTYYVMKPELSVREVRKWANVRVEALNHALRGIPPERIRFHTCYSINFGPRVHDMELKDVVDLILKVNAGAYSFEAANPRHEHEWEVWKDVKLPKGKTLIPGVVTQSSILVEHPELVKQRILRFASVVGRENVIAGTDCGFATFAGSTEIHPSIAWAKLQALSQGAALASKELWPRKKNEVKQAMGRRTRGEIGHGRAR